MFIENYIPVVKWHGLNTEKDINASGSNTFSGATTFSGSVVSNVEVVTATNVLTAADSGKTFALKAAAGFVTTLPAHQAGLNFRFIVQTAPTSNGYTVVAHANNQATIFGHAVERAGGAGVAGASEDNCILVANQSIVGDWVDVISDGTNWYVNAFVDVSAGITFNT